MVKKKMLLVPLASVLLVWLISQYQFMLSLLTDNITAITIIVVVSTLLALIVVVKNIQRK